MKLAYKRPANPCPARMRPLAKPPVFPDLAGKRAVVAGGTAAAAWKVELLAAAGALVEVYAVDPGPELRQLISVSGPYTHHARTWDKEIFAGAAIAVGDLAEDAAAFAKAA